MEDARNRKKLYILYAINILIILLRILLPYLLPKWKDIWKGFYRQIDSVHLFDGITLEFLFFLFIVGLVILNMNFLRIFSEKYIPKYISADVWKVLKDIISIGLLLGFAWAIMGTYRIGGSIERPISMN